MKEDWITVEDAAALSGYNADYIRKLANAGKIEARKFAIVWQISKASLLKYLKNVGELGEKRGRKKQG